MHFPDGANVFTQVDEGVLNKLIVEIMQQRPSLFNYATVRIAEEVNSHPSDPTIMDQWLCAPIVAADHIGKLVTSTAELDVIGAAAPLGLDFCLQIPKLYVDLHPKQLGFPLPSECAPLEAQQFLLYAHVTGHLADPEGKYLEALEDNQITQILGGKIRRLVPEYRPKVCFHLDTYAVAHFREPASEDEEYFLRVGFDYVHIANIEPDAMAKTLATYIKALLQLTLLPRLNRALASLVVLGVDYGIEITPTPSSAELSENPMIANDQFRLFLDLEVSS